MRGDRERERERTRVNIVTSLFNRHRLKLEYYEQACAVDSVTKKCAGRPSGCRTAMIGILGTMLRTTCACQGTDPQHLYQCVGWRRLLWMNPCVGEYCIHSTYCATEGCKHELLLQLRRKRTSI